MGCRWSSLLNINLETRKDGYVLFEESSLDSKSSGFRENEVQWSFWYVDISKIGGWTFKYAKGSSSTGGKK